jgi:tetratricopeptide (TPR) repeat protein
MSLPDFWTRIRQARLVQVLVVYVGASWLVLQVAAALTSVLSLPEWVGPVAVILLLIGLVIVMATAWVHATPRAVQPGAAAPKPEAWQLDVRGVGTSLRRGRLPHLTWPRALLGGVVALSLLFGVAGGIVLVRGNGPASPIVSGPASGIAVLPFDTRGVEEELWGVGMVDLLSTNLDGVGGLRGIDSRTVLARWREAGLRGEGDLAAALRVGAATGASYAVLGSVVGVGTDVRIAARVYDLATSRELGTAEVRGSPEQLLSLVDELSVSLVRNLLEERHLLNAPPRNLASITTASVPALRAFLRGEAANRRADFPAAIRAYEEALAADSTFALAAHRLGNAWGWVRRSDAPETVSAVAHALRHSERLPRRDAEALRAYTLALDEFDPAGIYALERLSSAYPEDPQIWYLLGEARYHAGLQVLIPWEQAREAFDRAIGLDSTYAPAYIHAIELRIGDGRDPAGARRLLAAYERIAAGDGRLSALWLAYRLAHEPDDVVAASFDDVPPEVVDYAFGSLARGGGGNIPAFQRLANLVAERNLSLAMMPPDVSPNEMIGIIAALRGQVERFRQEWRSAETAGFAGATRQLAVSAGHPLPGELIEQTLALDFAARPWIAFDVGILAVHLGREDARRRATAALRELPVDTTRVAFPGAAAADALDALAVWRAGRSDEALKRFEQLRLSLIGGRGPAERLGEELRFWIGMLEAGQGRHERAVLFFRSLPYDPHARLHLAESYEALGRAELAARAYADALRIWEHADPDFTPAQRARRGLERLRSVAA